MDLFWPSEKEEKKDPAVGPPNCVEIIEDCTDKCKRQNPDSDEKMQECATECKRKNPECASTSGGRRKKSLKKGGRKSRKSRSYRSKSRGSKSRGLKKRT